MSTPQPESDRIRKLLSRLPPGRFIAFENAATPMVYFDPARSPRSGQDLEDISAPPFPILYAPDTSATTGAVFVRFIVAALESLPGLLDALEMAQSEARWADTYFHEWQRCSDALVANQGNSEEPAHGPEPETPD